MTENEKKLLEQVYAKVCEMEEKVTKLGDSVKGLNNETIEGHKGLKATFEQGFADVHNGLDEINKNIKKIKKNGKQVH